MDSDQQVVNKELSLWTLSARSATGPLKNNYFTEMCSGSEAGSYLRRVDSCVTQLKAEGPFRFYNESKEEDEEEEQHLIANPKPGRPSPICCCAKREQHLYWVLRLVLKMAQAKDRIWPGLSDVCRIRSTAANGQYSSQFKNN